MKKKKIRTDYKICPYCGASLDVGETCDCGEEKRPSERPQDGLKATKAYIYIPKGESALERRTEP